MFADTLIPVPIADRIRIAHNEQSFEGKSAQAFIRARKLTSSFADMADLRKAIEYNSLWTTHVMRYDSAACRVVAAPHFTAMLHAGGTKMLEMDRLNGGIAPPFPRHDGLILEFARDEDSSGSWTMTWRDELVGHRCELKSSSLRAVFVRALEICAGRAEATLEAFERYSTAH